MRLVLAIEPDRRQAAQIANVVRKRLGAELALVNTTEDALEALGKRIPDLVLVPALLSPKDDAALAEALREVADAAPVPMLITPVLATGSASTARGLVSKWRRARTRVASSDGCDPEVFAEQVAAYLHEPGDPTFDREAPADVDVLDAAAPDAAIDPALREDDEPENVEIPETQEVPAIEAHPLIGEPKQVTEPVAAAADPAREPIREAFGNWSPSSFGLQAEWPSLLERRALDRRPERPSSRVTADAPAGQEPSGPGETAGDTARTDEDSEWTELIASLQRAVDGLRVEEWLAHQPKPVRDEWGIYDPQQCGIEMLVQTMPPARRRDDGTS